MLSFAQLAFLGDTDEQGGWVNGLHGFLALIVLLAGVAYLDAAARALGLRGAASTTTLGREAAPRARRPRYQRTASIANATPTAIPNAEEQPFPGRVLELLAADVAEQRRVRAPEEPGDDVRDDESAPRHAVRVAGRERDGGPAAGDESRDDDDVEAAGLELALGPLEAVPCACRSGRAASPSAPPPRSR